MTPLRMINVPSDPPPPHLPEGWPQPPPLPEVAPIEPAPPPEAPPAPEPAPKKAADGTTGGS